AGLGAGACREVAGRRGEAEASAKCAAPARADDAAYARLAAAMKEIAAQVHARAPKARLVFVDYLTILPANGVCAVTPLSAADAAGDGGLPPEPGGHDRGGRGAGPGVGAVICLLFPETKSERRGEDEARLGSVGLSRWSGEDHRRRHSWVMAGPSADHVRTCC